MGPARQVGIGVALVVAIVVIGPAPAAVAQSRPTGGAESAPPDPPGGTEALAAARAEAARLEREVASLDTEVEVLAEANATAQVRLDHVIQAAHRQRAALERSELALAATRETFAGDVRDLYARGPLAPLALLLGARDTHELALAGGVAGRVLERDRQALAVTGLAAGTVRTRLAELEATQAEAVSLRRRLAGQAAAIGERLERRRAVLATARAEVRALVQAEWARREAVRRALVAAAALRARGFGLGAFADAPAPSPTAAAAVRAALDQIGKPYRWGATGPEAFDCSGLVRWAYAQAGLALPRTSREQWWAGQPVDAGGLRPGDLVFWATDPSNPATIHHVGIYVGQALMVHAPHTGAHVRVDPLRPGGYAGATRPAGGSGRRGGGGP
jgi:cell wall-associated NlpC family hydrolase